MYLTMHRLDVVAQSTSFLSKEYLNEVIGLIQAARLTG
jgi:hypothetical protein